MLNYIGQQPDVIIDSLCNRDYLKRHFGVETEAQVNSGDDFWGENGRASAQPDGFWIKKQGELKLALFDHPGIFDVQ